MRRRSKRVRPFQVTDVNGFLWDVKESRKTKHGFDLHFADRHGGGLPKLIATPDLVKFWVFNSLKEGILFDLPAGRTTLKRMRSKLGFNQRVALKEFWTQRLGDLAAMTAADFSERYGVCVGTVRDRRTKMVGLRARPVGWWRKAKTIDLLLSERTLREIGEKLGIKTSQVWRLRKQAQKSRSPTSS